MISLEVFCPFERIAAQIAKLAGDANSIELDFGPFGTRVFHPVLGYDQDLGFTVKERLEFMQMQEFEGEVAIVYDEVSTKKTSFRVSHSLLTSSPVRLPTKIGGKLNQNGYIGNLKVWYPEAYYTVAYSDVGACARAVSSSSHLRPWYNYIARYDGVFDVWGPAVESETSHSCFATYKSDLTEDTLYDAATGGFWRQELHPDEGVSEEIDAPTSTWLNRSNVILRYVDVKGVSREEYFTFGQRAVGDLGQRLSPEVSYYAMLLDGLHDLDESEAYILDLVDVDGQYALDDVSRARAMRVVRSSPLGADLSKAYDYSRIEVLLRKGQKLGSVLRHSDGSGTNEACFALSLATLLASGSETKSLTRLFLLRDLVDQDYLSIVDGEIHGKTGSRAGELLQLPYREGLAVRTGVFVRRDLGKEAALVKGQWYMLGLENKASSAGPDHWVVVEYDGARLRLRFDPYLSDARKYDVDMTGERLVPGAYLLEFASSFPSLGGTVDAVSKPTLA